MRWGSHPAGDSGFGHVRLLNFCCAAAAILALQPGTAKLASAQDVRAPVQLPPVEVTAGEPSAKKKAPRAKQQQPASPDSAQASQPAEDAAATQADAQANAVGVGTNVPQAVQVVNRQEIQRQLQINPSPAAALAKLVPGYSVPTGTISSASETFRGREVQVMLDGVVLNTPLRDVSRIVNLIDLNTVERIEVVAGASSLYGSNATGGTINFVTLKPTAGKPTVTVNTSISAFTANLGESLAPTVSGSITGKSQTGIDYVLAGSGRWADKTYDGAGREMPSDAMLGQGGSDRFDNGSFLAKLGYDLNATQRIEVSGTWVYFDQQPDWLTDYSQPFARPDFSSPYTGESVHENSKSFSARFTDKGTPLGKLTLLGFYNDIEKRFNYSELSALYNQLVYYSGNAADPTSPFNQTTLYSKRGGVNATIETRLDYLLPGAILTWGGDAVHDSTSQQLTNGEDVFNPMAQTNLAGFAQLQVPVGERLTVRGGIRYEHFDLTVEDFVRPDVYVAFAGLGYAYLPDLPVQGGSFTYSSPTYNLGATFKLTERSEVFGGFSQGFNLPDVGAFTRRAGANPTGAIPFYGCQFRAPPTAAQISGCRPPLTSISYGTIAPETQIVNNYELGLRGAGQTWRGSLTGFISTSENGVNFTPATNTITQQKEKIYGVEFAGEVAVSKSLSLGMVVTWREGRYDSNSDGDIDSYLPNNRIATPYRGTVYADYRFDNGWLLHLEGEGWSDRDEVINTTGTHYPIDGAFLVNAGLVVPYDQGQLYLGANNIFDAEYENPTATSVRNLPINGLGRTVILGYRKTF